MNKAKIQKAVIPAAGPSSTLAVPEAYLPDSASLWQAGSFASRCRDYGAAESVS